MPKSRIVLRGAKKAARRIREIRTQAKSKGVKKVQVGFLRGSRDQDGTPLALVAAANEFGTEGIPERPFFRQAIPIAVPEIKKLLAARIDPETMIIDERLGRELGEILKDRVRERIEDLRSPPNAPATAESKGTANPLLDSRGMLRAVDVRVEEK